MHSLVFYQQRTLVRQLTPGYMVERIKGHLLTCATLRDVAQPLRREYIAGVSACVTSLRLVLKPSVNRPVHSDEDTKLRKKYIQGLVDDLDTRRRVCHCPLFPVASCIQIEGLRR